MNYLPPMLAKYMMLTRHSIAQDQEMRNKHLEWMGQNGYANPNEMGGHEIDMNSIHNDLDGFARSNIEFAHSIGSTPDDLYGESTRMQAWIDHTKKVMKHYPDFVKHMSPEDRASMHTLAIHADHDPDFQDRYAGTIEKYIGENGHSRGLRWRASDNRRVVEGKPTHYDLGFQALLPDESPDGIVTFTHPNPQVEAQINNPENNMDHEQIVLTFAPEYLDNFYKKRGFNNEQQEQPDTRNIQPNSEEQEETENSRTT